MERDPVDEVHDKLTDIRGLVEGARSLPMSASAVVNRVELLALLDQLEQLLPEAFMQAQEVLGDKRGVVEQGKVEARRIVDQAREERRRMLAQTDVLAEAEQEAARVLEQAHAESDGMRAEVEDYVDAKLATFEIVLTKTLSAVERGREKLSGRHELDELGDSFLDEPQPG